MLTGIVGLSLLAGCKAQPTSLGTAAEDHREVVSAEPTATQRPVSGAVAKPVAKPKPAPALLHAAPGGDGDSWKDTAGREYRLGLVNAPETNECYGNVATSKRKQLVAGGFRARVYTHDSYGRSVSVVSLPDGTNLNVWLARHGYVNDKYLAQFRFEEPSLAGQLDVAFAAAKREKAGLWSACAPKPVVQTLAQQPSSSCHPAYSSCVPIMGDGSGSGGANDLDCPDIGEQVQVKQLGVDPYRLDADGDGIGCESY